ncbi:MAG: radical SAM protein [Candidatus Lokiarchaeota archaeon]|nr:radical SAM protein [Candidatus Lokiarchaeota archaeon]
MIWDFTKKCNLNCVYCYTEAKWKFDPNELTVQQIKEEVIPQFGEVKLRGLCLAGGEPLLRYDDILEIGKDLVDSGLKEFLLATNGILLTRKRLNALIKALDGIELFTIGLPIDSLQEIVYNKLRPAYEKSKINPFQQVMEAYKLCNQKNLLISVETVFNSENYSELNDIINFIKKKSPLVQAEMYPLFLSGRGLEKKKLLLSKDQLLEFDQIRIKHYGDPCLFWDFTPFIPNLEEWEMLKREALELGITEGCTCCTEYIQMNYNGQIFPCSFLRLDLGNILTDGLKYIWNNNPLVQKFRNRYVEEGKCKDCLYNKVCGGCRARAFNETGNPFGSIPSCEGSPNGHPMEEIFTKKLKSLIEKLRIIRKNIV